MAVEIVLAMFDYRENRCINDKYTSVNHCYNTGIQLGEYVFMVLSFTVPMWIVKYHTYIIYICIPTNSRLNKNAINTPFNCHIKYKYKKCKYGDKTDHWYTPFSRIGVSSKWSTRLQSNNSQCFMQMKYSNRERVGVIAIEQYVQLYYGEQVWGY